jgi:hypothetical protein
MNDVNSPNPVTPESVTRSAPQARDAIAAKIAAGDVLLSSYSADTPPLPDNLVDPDAPTAAEYESAPKDFDC